MPIPEIEHWLQGSRDYGIGVKLFEHFGQSNFLKQMFAKGETDFNQERLQDELRQLSEAVPDAQQAQVMFKIASSSEYDALPEQIKKLEQEKTEKFKRMAYLHSQLLNQKTDKQRYELAKEILELDRFLQDAWAKLDHYAEHGTMPAEEKIEIKEASPTQQLIRRNNLRTYISKFEDDSAKQKKVIKWKAELKALDEKLGE